MTITTIGLDLAKKCVPDTRVGERGSAVLRKQLRRDQVAAFFAKLQPCLVGVEACGGAHFWAGQLTKLGHCDFVWRDANECDALASCRRKR